MKFHKLKIEKIQRETPQAVSICFQVPTELKNEYAFQAGQYVSIQLKLNGEELRRAYSISSSPNSDELRIAVKEIPNGKFSVFANKELKEGQILEVSKPEGTFFSKNPQAHQIVTIAAGSGITPVISIIKAHLEKNDESQVALIYGNRSKEETIYYEEIEALKTQYENRLFVYYLFSKKQEPKSLFGRIERSTINFVLKNKHSHWHVDEYFICGPKGMIDVVENVLQENGVTKDQIHYELFTSDADSVDNPVESNELITVEAVVDGETYSIQMPRNISILDGLLKNNIDAPYSCQGGICSSCVCKTIEGSAEMRVNHILMDDDIEDGHILACQSFVTSDAIKVDFDEV